jgi:2',3'-cyclic-nucleotide 2'-phosphodiesterase (5'-nucleotidase family)
VVGEVRATARGSDRPVFLVDTGDTLHAHHTIAAGETARIRRTARFILEAMGELGYHAMAVGPRDLVVGFDTLTEAAQAAGVRLLAANLRVSGQRRPFRAHEIIEEGGVRIGLIGLASADHDTRTAQVFLDAGVTATDPVAAAQAAVAELAGQADLLVILGNLTAREARAVARAVPEARLFLAGGSGHLIGGEPVNDAVLLYEPGHRGQVVLELSMTLRGSGPLVELGDDPEPGERTVGSGGTVRTRFRPLDTDVPDAPEMAARVAPFLSERARSRSD